MIASNPQDWGEAEIPLLEGAHRASCAPQPKEKAGSSQETGPDLPAGLGESPGELRGGCGSLWGQRHWWQWFWGVLIGVRLLGGCHFLTKTWPHPTAYRPQCWDTSGQTTNRVGTQPQPPADRVPKILVSPQLPGKHTS